MCHYCWLNHAKNKWQSSRFVTWDNSLNAAAYSSWHINSSIFKVFQFIYLHDEKLMGLGKVASDMTKWAINIVPCRLLSVVCSLCSRRQPQNVDACWAKGKTDSGNHSRKTSKTSDATTQRAWEDEKRNWDDTNGVGGGVRSSIIPYLLCPIMKLPVFEFSEHIMKEICGG